MSRRRAPARIRLVLMGGASGAALLALGGCGPSPEHVEACRRARDAGWSNAEDICAGTRSAWSFSGDGAGDLFDRNSRRGGFGSTGSSIGSGG